MLSQRKTHYSISLTLTKKILFPRLLTPALQLNMKQVQRFLLLQLVAMAAVQLSFAQDVTDCTAISVGLETFPIDPVTG